MRFVLSVLLLLASVPARAQSDADVAAIQSVIGNQIEAFRRDDSEAAFALASPMIQQMFGSAGRFMAMVEHVYPPVYRPRDLRFGVLATNDGQLEQRVELVGPDDRSYTAVYTMEQQPDGGWKINGCQIVENESVGA